MICLNLHLEYIMYVNPLSELGVTKLFGYMSYKYISKDRYIRPSPPASATVSAGRNRSVQRLTVTVLQSLEKIESKHHLVLGFRGS